MSKVETAIANIKELGLSDSELLEVAHKLIGSLVTVKSEGELKAQERKEQKYQFVKERIVKSKAKKVKALKKMIQSYFRGDGNSISNNEIEWIVERLVGERVIFINANDDVEFLVAT